MSKIDTLALENDYFACVIQEKHNVIKVLYPANNRLKLKEDIFTFYFYKNELFVALDGKIKKIDYLDYELRPFVASFIIMKSIDRGIPPKYRKCYDQKNNEVKLVKLMPKPHLTQKETLLFTKILDYINTRKIEDKDMARNVQRFRKFYEEQYA